MVRASRRVFTAALLVPLVLLALAGSSHAVMACRMMGGLVSADCCCPAADDPVVPTEVDTVDEPGCCTVTTVELAPTPSTPARDAAFAELVPVPIAQPIAFAHSSEGASATRPRARVWFEPPHDGRSVLLAKRSFLI